MMQTGCGCDGQTARCETGIALVEQIERLYQQFADPSFVQWPWAWREAWWCQYEGARQAYFVHIGWEVVTESEVA